MDPRSDAVPPGTEPARNTEPTRSPVSGGRATYLRRALVAGGVVLIVLAAIAVPLILNERGPAAGPPAGSSAGAAASPAATVSSASVGPSATATPPPLGSMVPSTPASEPSQTTTAGTAGPLAIVADRITIARLGIDLPIVEGDGIDAPLGKAAHFPGTAWPGGGSNIYLYGHARDGSFISLWKARVGDEVVLHLVDGSERIYQVSKVLPGIAWNDMSVVAPTAAEQLSLQTCNSYQATAPRFLVIAVPKT